MKKSEKQILNLIDQKIHTFEEIQSEATQDNPKKEEYNLVFESARNIIQEIYSEDEARRFSKKVNTIASQYSKDSDYKKITDKITRCNIQLKAYKERINSFYTEQNETIINWPLLKRKLEVLLNLSKIPREIIAAILLVIGLLTQWDNIDGYISTILNYIGF